jgi:hypothetical protein
LVIPEEPRDSVIFIKTVGFKKNTITYIEELKEKMAQKSGKGYCERVVENMLQVSNKALCKGVNRDVGYYYKITFPVCEDGTTYGFKVPTDFGRGGLSMMDGKIMKEHSKDIWQGGKSNKLDFSAKLSKGNHVLELYGSEGCCDGKTTWKFQVNGGKWLDFTQTNLDNSCVRKVKAEYKGCALRFDGKNDAISVKTPTTKVDDITMETWVFAESLKDWRVIRNDKGWTTGDTHF